MLIWCSVLLGLGVLAFLDSQFNYGYIFRSVNSILFMFISLGLLVRARILMKLGFTEKLIKTNKEPQDREGAPPHARSQTGKRESKQEVSI